MMEMGEHGGTLTAEQVQMIARAMADPRRYKILRRLGESQAGIACEVLRAYVEISPATLSHHMKELELAGLVFAERKGKFVHYMLQRAVLEAFFLQLKRDIG